MLKIEFGTVNSQNSYLKFYVNCIHAYGFLQKLRDPLLSLLLIAVNDLSFAEQHFLQHSNSLLYSAFIAEA